MLFDLKKEPSLLKMKDENTREFFNPINLKTKNKKIIIINWIKYLICFINFSFY